MAYPFRFEVDRLNYQSQNITITEWITLFTLCLAPLIAHIVAGVPQASYLHQSRPKWYQRLCHYNPTSILWRYAMITDRRIRCRSWDHNTIAATNALFWTSEGWEGSEVMAEVSFEQNLHLPEHTRVPIFSAEMLKTSIVTLQGVQAIYTIIEAVVGTGSSSNALNSPALDTVFFPLAIIGLWRLFCAFWLTDDYAYSPMPTHDAVGRSHIYVGTDDSGRFSDIPCKKVDFTPRRCRQFSSWASIAFRVAFILPLLVVCAIPILYLTLSPWTTLHYQGVEEVTGVTSLVLILFYLVLFTATTAIIAIYFICGHTSSILPCIHSIWYKVYSTVLLGLAVALFIIACVETRKTPCGRYTSISGSLGDKLACETAQGSLVYLSAGSNSTFGIAVTTPNTVQGTSTKLEITETSLGNGDFLVYNFTGTCIGTWGDDGQVADLVQEVNATDVTAF